MGILNKTTTLFILTSMCANLFAQTTDWSKLKVPAYDPKKDITVQTDAIKIPASQLPTFKIDMKNDPVGTHEYFNKNARIKAAAQKASKEVNARVKKENITEELLPPTIAEKLQSDLPQFSFGANGIGLGKYGDIVVQNLGDGAFLIDGQLAGYRGQDRLIVSNHILYNLAYHYHALPYIVMLKIEIEQFAKVLARDNDPMQAKKLKQIANEYARIAIEALQQGDTDDVVFVLASLYTLMFDEGYDEGRYILGSGVMRDIGSYMAALTTGENKNKIVSELKKLRAIRQCDYSFTARKPGGVHNYPTSRYVNIAHRRHSNNYNVLEKSGRQTADYLDISQNNITGGGSVFSVIEHMLLTPKDRGNFRLNIEENIGSAGSTCLIAGLATYNLALIDRVEIVKNRFNGTTTIQPVVTINNLLSELEGEYGNDHVNTIRGFLVLEAILVNQQTAAQRVDAIDAAIMRLAAKQRRENTYDTAFEERAGSFFQPGYVLIGRAMTILNMLSKNAYGKSNAALRKYSELQPHSSYYTPSVKYAALINYAAVFASRLNRDYPDYKYEMTPHYTNHVRKGMSTHYTLKIKGVPAYKAEQVDYLINKLYGIINDTSTVTVSNRYEQVALNRGLIESVISQLMGNKANGVVGIMPEKGKTFVPQYGPGKLEPVDDPNLETTDFGYRVQFNIDSTKSFYTPLMRLENFAGNFNIVVYDFTMLFWYYYGIGIINGDTRSAMYQEAKRNVKPIIENLNW
ncbi:hypothetical protein AAIR98_000827 [Elusimicrobium simillimum]|uniref:hypothetical protein n=1 Tax=Elusimicrobium simillimum TaxID=3143438 RepID=UPI003C705DDC